MEYYILIVLFAMICASVATDEAGKVIALIAYAIAPYVVMLLMFLNRFPIALSIVSFPCTRLITIIIAKKYM